MDNRALGPLDGRLAEPADAAARETRKPVTVLFADLVESTRLGLATRPRGTAPAAAPLFRDDAIRGRAPRRNGREVHRGRRDGGLRRAGRARGRCASRRAGRRRDARIARATQRGARADLGHLARGPHRHQHRRGDRGRSPARPAVRRGAGRERRQAPRGGRRDERDPDERGDARSRARRRGGGARLRPPRQGRRDRRGAATRHRLSRMPRDVHADSTRRWSVASSS